MSRDYAYCVGIGYFNHPDLCKNYKRHIPFTQPSDGCLTWTMPQYDEKTGKCPLHEPKPSETNEDNT